MLLATVDEAVADAEVGTRLRGGIGMDPASRGAA